MSVRATRSPRSATPILALLLACSCAGGEAGPTGSTEAETMAPSVGEEPASTVRLAGSNGFTSADIPLAEFMPELLHAPVSPQDSGVTCPPGDIVQEQEAALESFEDISPEARAELDMSALAVARRRLLAAGRTVERDRADNVVEYMELAEESRTHATVVVPWFPGRVDGPLLARVSVNVDVDAAGRYYRYLGETLCLAIWYAP